MAPPVTVTNIFSRLRLIQNSKSPTVALAATLFFCLFTGSARAQIPTDFLAYWQLEETSGPVIDSGGSNDGVAIGVERGVPGVVGNGARFAGNASSYVLIPHTPDFPTTEVTILAWVKFDRVGGDYPMFLSGGGNDGLGWDYALYNEAGRHFRAAYRAADGSTPNVDSTTMAEPGIWYHVAMTHDGTNLSIYVNGVMENSTAAPPLAPSTRDFYLGREARNNCCTLAGYLDEVQLYGRSLVATEMEAIAEAGFAGVPLIPGEPVIVDSDDDGLADADDACVNSILSATVAINGVDSGVANPINAMGCSIADLLDSACSGDFKNHGQFESCVAHAATELRKAGIITNNERSALVKAAAKSEKSGKSEKSSKTEKSAKSEKSGNSEKSDKTKKSGKSK